MAKRETVTERTEAQVEQDLLKTRGDLARMEEQLSELRADTEPTTDLAAETARAQAVLAAETALKRVIEANRRKLDDLQAEYTAVRIPRIEAELAAARTEAAELAAYVGELLWEAYNATDRVAVLQDAIVACKRYLSEARKQPHFSYFAGGDVAALAAVRGNVAQVLSSDLKLAKFSAGPAGSVLSRIDPAVEAAADAQRAEQTARQAGVNKAKAMLMSLKAMQEES